MAKSVSLTSSPSEGASRRRRVRVVIVVDLYLGTIYNLIKATVGSAWESTDNVGIELDK